MALVFRVAFLCLATFSVDIICLISGLFVKYFIIHCNKEKFYNFKLWKATDIE